MDTQKLFSPPVSTGITTVARLVIGAVFIVAALDKIIAPDEFAKSILNYLIVPDQLINLMALVLPWLELLCGIALVLGMWVRTSAAIAGALLVIFIVAVASAMLQGLDINCGCFSQKGEGTKVGWPKVFENIGLTTLAVWMVIFPESFLSLEKYLRFETPVAEAQQTL